MKEQPLTWYSTTGPQAGKEQTWEGSKDPRGYTPFVQAAVKACATMDDPPVASSESLRALSTVFANLRGGRNRQGHSPSGLIRQHLAD